MTIDNPPADNSADHEDQKLVLRARSGDRKALEELVRRHQAWIYNIAVRMLYHPQDAEDATQEILIKVLTRLSSFEGRSSFRTWLYRIVVNHVLNHEARAGGGAACVHRFRFLRRGARQHAGIGTGRSQRHLGGYRPARDRSDDRLYLGNASVP